MLAQLCINKEMYIIHNCSHYFVHAQYDAVVTTQTLLAILHCSAHAVMESSLCKSVLSKLDLSHIFYLVHLEVVVSRKGKKKAKLSLATP